MLVTSGHMTRLAVAAATVVAAGCSSGSAAENEGDCGAVVVWRGVVLTGINAKGLELPPVSDVTHELAPGCDSQKVTINELVGVDPRLALLELDHGSQYALYIANGVFLQQPDHPLHKSFYKSATRPRLDRGRRCRPARTALGKVVRTEATGGYLVIRVRGKRQFWRVDARSRIESGTLAGMPRLRKGQKVQVSGVRCGPYRVVARTVKAV